MEGVPVARGKALLVFLLFVPAVAEARGVCDYFEEYHPELFRRYCHGGASGRLPEVGGALASFSDAFNLNPASIPTHPTPLGVEVILTPSTTTYGGTNYNFAFIRGFQRFGAALSTNSDNTFYSNKTWRTPTLYETTYSLPSSFADLSTPTLNGGASLRLIESAEVTTSLGVSARYNRVSKDFGVGGGIGVVTRHLSAGLSVNRDASNAGSGGGVLFYNATASLRFNFLQLDYNYIQNTEQFYTGGINIWTLTVTLGSFLVTGAFRTFEDVYGIGYAQHHGALQWRVSDRIALGYLINYVPGTSSVGAQVFLF